jgi:hypothetical protein
MVELIKGYDSESLEGKIENEGLDYFFQGYISLENILDDALLDAVKDYLDARSEIIYILNKHGISVDE